MRPIISVILFLTLAIGASAGEIQSSKAKRFELGTLKYRDATVKDILEDIAIKSREVDPRKEGLNIVNKLSDQENQVKLTMTVGKATGKRALDLLAATRALYIRYTPDSIFVQKSGRLTGE